MTLNIAVFAPIASANENRHRRERNVLNQEPAADPDVVSDPLEPVGRSDATLMWAHNPSRESLDLERPAMQSVAAAHIVTCRSEGLERFVQREPLRRVHESVLCVLALESEPVDPRLRKARRSPERPASNRHNLQQTGRSRRLARVDLRSCLGQQPVGRVDVESALLPCLEQHGPCFLPDVLLPSGHLTRLLVEDAPNLRIPEAVLDWPLRGDVGGLHAVLLVPVQMVAGACNRLNLEFSWTAA